MTFFLHENEISSFFFFFNFIIIFIFILPRKSWELSCAVPAQDSRYEEVRLYFFIKNVKSVIRFFEAILFPECMLTHGSSVTFERSRSTNSLLALHPALTL